MDDDKRVIGQASAEVLELVAMLAKTHVGEMVTYRHMTRTIGVDVVVRRHLLASARRILMREHNMVFGCVMNEGLKLLDCVEVVDITPEERRKRIHQQAKLGIRELATVKYEALPPEKQAAQNVGLALLGALHTGSNRATVKKLEHKVANGKLPDSLDVLKVIGWETE
jgi:hypothetical protein